MKDPSQCVVRGCMKHRSHSSKWCSMHRSRVIRNGSPDKVSKLNMVGATEMERIWARIKRSDSGCWEWQGGINACGYGLFTYQHKSASAHLLTYRHLVGPIPDGLQLDHLCRNRRCVNPSHLEPVTQYVNTVSRAPTSVSGLNARKTHCIRGHELPPYERGAIRYCAPCRRMRQRAARLAKKAALA